MSWRGLGVWNSIGGVIWSVGVTYIYIQGRCYGAKIAVQCWESA